VDVKIAIPRMGEAVAPCFEYSATIALFTVEEGRVVDQLDFPLRSPEPLDRVRLLRDQHVDTIICGGVQDVFEDLVRATRQGLVEDNTINTHILHIRNKFKQVDSAFKCIKTRYGFGYSWVC